MSGFLGGIINSVPGVGHLKGVIHYAVGDVDGGNKAMYESTRATAVLAGGAIGALGGPAGALAGASGAGLLTDTVCSIATQQAHGVIEGLGDVGSDVLHGRLPVRSVLKTGALAVSDLACGLGAGGISVGIKSVTKTTVKRIVVSSNTLLIGGISSQGALGSVPSCPPMEAEARKYRSRNRSPNRSNGNNNNQSNKNQSSSSTKTNTDNQQSSNASSGSGSERPNNNRNNKNDHSTPGVEKPEITQLRAMFDNVALDKISLGKTSKQIFKDLSSGQIDSLVSLIKTLQQNGRFEVIIRTVIYVCDNIDPEEITFENFLSISEFVNVYIEEQMKNHLMWSSRIRIQKICFTPKQESDEKLYVRCCETIMQLIKSLRDKVGNFPFTEYFRDIFSAFYHYYKHRIIPITNREIGIDEYLALIESMMEKVKKYQEYRDLANPNHTRRVLVFDRYYNSVSRRVRIVLKSYRGNVTLSSCFIRKKYYHNDRDGDEFIVDDSDSS